MGDLLQFCRYIPMLAERVHREGGRLIWNSFPQMGALLGAASALMRTSFRPAARRIATPFDYEFPLLSLPLIFDTREETIPASALFARGPEQPPSPGKSGLLANRG